MKKRFWGMRLNGSDRKSRRNDPRTRYRSSPHETENEEILFTWLSCFNPPLHIVPDGSFFPLNLYVPKYLSETKREGRGGGRLNGSDRARRREKAPPMAPSACSSCCSAFGFIRIITPLAPARANLWELLRCECVILLYYFNAGLPWC